jgi:hypothetical protein
MALLAIGTLAFPFGSARALGPNTYHCLGFGLSLAKTWRGMVLDLKEKFSREDVNEMRTIEIEDVVGVLVLGKDRFLNRLTTIVIRASVVFT